jgi:hypothetical protein
VKLAERGIGGIHERLRGLQRGLREADAKAQAAQDVVRASGELLAVERARIDELERTRKPAGRAGDEA